MTTAATLTLWLGGRLELQLSRTSFFHPLIGAPLATYRGRTSLMGEGTFIWSSAVKALCVLLIRAVLAHKQGLRTACLSGEHGSLAASLDYALSKKPSWVLDMFGMDGGGRPLIKRILLRRNPERKRCGPVDIFLNHNFLHPSSIHIILGEKELTLTKELEAALHSLSGQPEPGHSFTPLTTGPNQEREAVNY